MNLRITLFTVSVFFLFASCNKKDTEIQTLFVNVQSNNTLMLSEITESLVKINLEFTDQSMIGSWEYGYDVLLAGDHIVFIQQSKTPQILLFNKDGKFIRSIGRRGQGPGEFGSISTAAVDAKNDLIYIVSGSKIISYDFHGNLINEKTIIPEPEYLYFNEMRNQLMYLKSFMDEKEYFSKTFLYNMDKGLNIVDSIFIQRSYPENATRAVSAIHVCPDYISITRNHLYVYRPVIFPPEPFLRDTLYILKNNQMIPCLKLQFDAYRTMEDNTPNISIAQIHMNSRYLFCNYSIKRQQRFSFYYDFITKKGYNSKDGFRDDIYTQKSIQIRPLANNPDKIYYLNTEEVDLDEDEPNPTLYIATLKR